MAKKYPCFFCGEPVDTFVRDAVSKRKVPLCEKCFMDIFPSKKNKQKLHFWMVIYPIIEEV